MALARAIAERPRLEAEQAKQTAIAKDEAAALKHLDERLAPFAALDDRLQQAAERKKASEPGYRRYLAVAGIADELASRSQAKAEAIARYEALEKELATLSAQARERSAAYQADEHSSLRERVEGLKAETIRFEQAVGFLAQQLERTRQEMNDLRRVQEEMKDAIAARERLVAHASFVEFARATLKEAGPFITEAYLMNISLEADRLFREITGHHHVHLSWSNDYEILLEEEGRPRPFNNLSGGEQMAAALSVRLALLKETSSVDMAFFDEPTTNMDESRRSNLAHQIGEIRAFKQLFVISHDDTFEQWTDHVVRVAGR
ncbi:chromosome segregation protein [compost metagenome]